MRVFKIEITMDNALFDLYPGQEVSNILEELSNDIRWELLTADGQPYALSDSNGNHVGYAIVEERPNE